MEINKKLLMNNPSIVYDVINNLKNAALHDPEKQEIPNLTLALIKNCIELLICHDLFIYMTGEKEQFNKDLDNVKIHKHSYQDFVTEYIRESFPPVFDDLMKRLKENKQERKVINEAFARKPQNSKDKPK